MALLNCSCYVSPDSNGVNISLALQAASNSFRSSISGSVVVVVVAVVVVAVVAVVAVATVVVAFDPPSPPSLEKTDYR